MVVLNFHLIVSFDFGLMSFLNFPLSQFSISVADCYPGMHLYHTLKMAKLGFLFCVASWLMFDCYNQQYTYWATLMISVEVILFVIMLVPAYLKKSKFFYIFVAHHFICNNKVLVAVWGRQHEEGRLRMAVLGWQWQDGGIITVVSWWWCSIFIELFLSILNSCHFWTLLFHSSV